MGISRNETRLVVERIDYEVFVRLVSSFFQTIQEATADRFTLGNGLTVCFKPTVVTRHGGKTAEFEGLRRAIVVHQGNGDLEVLAKLLYLLQQCARVTAKHPYEPPRIRFGRYLMAVTSVCHTEVAHTETVLVPRSPRRRSSDSARAAYRIAALEYTRKRDRLLAIGAQLKEPASGRSEIWQVPRRNRYSFQFPPIMRGGKRR